MLPKTITLTTDFGLKDPYVAEMKAATLSICPDCVIVDLTHLVEKFNVREGAFVLASAASYFPDGTVHVAVIDPGVGTQRRPIAIETKRGFFVGPDNGLLVLPAEAQGIVRIHEITSRRFMLSHVSGTFHGRDVFAPVAAHLAGGVDIEEMGPRITELARPKFTAVERGKDSLVGEVLHIDDFGNIITNLPAKDLAVFKEDVIRVELSGATLEIKISRSYADTKPHEPLALIGSHNYLEIALNQGDAAAKFLTKTGDKVAVTRT